jgi:hypothetical protein
MYWNHLQGFLSFYLATPPHVSIYLHHLRGFLFFYFAKWRDHLQGFLSFFFSKYRVQILLNCYMFRSICIIFSESYPSTLMSRSLRFPEDNADASKHVGVFTVYKRLSIPTMCNNEYDESYSWSCVIRNVTLSFFCNLYRGHCLVSISHNNNPVRLCHPKAQYL